VKSNASLTKELLSVATQDDKLSLIRIIAKEICNATTNKIQRGGRTVFVVTENHRKIDDLLLLCEDSDVEVIVAAVKQLIFVFCDMLPDYKIREDMDTKRDGNVTLSKDVRKTREQESYLLDSFKRFLQVLETFSKFKCHGMSETLKDIYTKLKVQAFETYAI
jgi:hypothetical protein